MLAGFDGESGSDRARSAQHVTGQLMPQSVACLCGNRDFETAFVYDEPPDGEVRFPLSRSARYHRELWRCRACGHFLSVHEMNLSGLYGGAYVDSTYGADGLRRAYDRVITLDPARSDNVGRVRRIVAFSSGYFDRDGRVPSVLDVGSGLCVFLQRLRSETGWQCTALDPDPRAVAHAREVVGVEALCGDFMSLSGLGRFDVITFNKVLEHVQEPVRMLAKAAEHLTPRGFVYVELPDGEAAAIEGPGREEFFIDHHHVFSMRSMEVLLENAGFHALATERLREPSTKFTLRAFAVPAAARSS